MSPSVTPQLGRNDPCHCGSGRKYKQCCLAKDEVAARQARAVAAENAPTPEATESHPVARTRHETFQPWKRSATNTHGFHRMSTPRKVGGG